MPSAAPVVAGLGDPVIDVVLNVSHEFLASMGAQPGGCTSVGADEMQALLCAAAAAGASQARVPGGSAANVMKGLAGVSGGSLSCRLMGMVGADDAGEFYAEQLRLQGVQPELLVTGSGAPTARCVCMVTPDGQRTMRTCLGASAELAAHAQLAPRWRAPALLHCEGYILYKPALAREAMAAAKAAGALVSLDLASFEVVRGCRAALMGLLESGLVDVVFANEEEAAALAEGGGGGGALAMGIPAGKGGKRTSACGPLPRVEAAQAIVLRHARACVVSLGARGAVARSSSGEAGSAAASKVQVVDTIGAGDLFSAGFLYAYLHGCGLSACCAAGCAAGAEAVQSRGAALSAAAWERLRAAVDRLVAVGAGGCPEAADARRGGQRDCARALCACKSPGVKGGDCSGSVLSSSRMSSASAASLRVASSMGSSASTQWLAGMDA